LCAVLPGHAAYALSVNLDATPLRLASGSASTLTWTSSGAKWCYGSGYLGGRHGLTGRVSTGPLYQNRWYKITCSDGRNEVSDSLTVVVDGASSLGVSLTATPAWVDRGKSSTLSWSSSGAKWCWGGGYLGGKDGLRGSHDTGPLYEKRWYKITCSDGNQQVSDALTVGVRDATAGVSVDLDAYPRQVKKGESSKLTWKSQGASSCTSSGGWWGQRPLSGSFDTGALYQSTSYKLTCQSGSQSALASITVQVDVPPVVRWQAPTQNVDGTPLTDLAGFRLYWGSKSRSYTGNARISSPSQTQYRTDNLPTGTYFIAVTALDQQGNESAYSNEVKVYVP
jgi:hypothetical protein